MQTLLLLVLLGVLIVLAVSLGGLALNRRRRAASSPSSSADPDTIEMQTEEQETGAVASVPRGPDSAPRRRGILTALVALVGVLLLGLAFFTWGGRANRAPERFVVLVAPFADGGDGQTGRNVATELTRLLDGLTRGALTAVVAPRSPADAEDALALAGAEGADLLIWGEVEPGGMLDSPTLRPRLIYTPTGPYAPNGWDGYMGRFAMPRSYNLAREPINGQAVLGPLVVALYDYARGQPDLAYAQLERLQQDYPGLGEPLPRALRGNILWARGFYAEAAAEYRRALAEPSDEQARLANNLGAILLDAGDPAALTAFAEAVRLLEGRDMGELRANLGTLALREQRPADAAVELEQARNLLPPVAPILLDLTAAYRDTGRLAEAATTLEAARRQVSRDARLVADLYRPMFTRRMEAAVDEQQALLNLARQLEAQGPIAWELEITPPQPSETLRGIGDQLSRAVETAEQAVAQWRRLAVSESAATGGGMLATGQAERAELHADRKRYYLGLVMGELEQVTRGQPSGIFGSLFGGGRSGSASLTGLSELAQRNPDSPQVQIALGRTQRILGQLDAADQSFDRALNLAPQAPEGYFGKGLVAAERGDPVRASELYNVALERNNAFFPARYELARLAEERRDWEVAIAQRRALMELRPGAASAVALAQDLRQSGQAGWAEAEQILIPLTGSSAEAAIELGRLYNDAGRPEAALSAYRDALAIDRESSVAAFELGETLAAQGDYANAERALRDSLRFDSQNLDARLALADLYQGPLNNSSRADAEYRTALSQGVSDPLRLEQIGDAAMGNGNAGQAVTAYGQALELRGDNPALHYKLGRAYAANGRLEQAAQAQLRALDLTTDLANPDTAALRAAALVSLGDIARRQGNIADANNAYGQALQIRPGMVDAQLGLGLVAVGQGNWGVAHGYFETAAALPDGVESAEAQFWLAESLLRRGDLRAATERYNQALALRPEFPEAYLGLAQTQQAQGDAETALATVNAGLAQRATYAEALLFKGKLLQEQGRNPEALAAYDQSIAANGRIAESYYRRGVLRIQVSQYDGAITDLRRASQLQPNFPEAAYWLGRAYYAQGRLDQALEAFRQAISYNGAYTDAIFYSGLVAEDLGRTAEAISAYQTVIQIDAGSDLAARARAQLSRLT